MPQRPPWVVKDLSAILGFDEATVSEAILPEFESQTHQARLQSHLQDFLGPSPKAKAFIEKYISHRFPSIPTPTPQAPPSLKSSKAPTPNPSNGQSTQTTRDIGRAVSDAFGSGGHVYHKNSMADAGGSSAMGASRGGSGSTTPSMQQQQPQLPQFRQPGRPGGSLIFHEAKSGKGKGKAVGAGNGSGQGGKGDKIWDVPKSREVKRLEGVKERLLGVQDGEKVKRDDNGIPDCFCQARVHTLSRYTPHCPHCGLILCSLQAPYLPCPSCAQHLYSPAQLARLLQRISAEIEQQLEKEQASRDALEREAHQRAMEQSGGGAFPTLSGGTSSGTRTAPVDNSRKVLTLGAGGKGGKGKATLTTTTYRTVSTPSTPAEPATPIPTDTVPRPRSPPLEPARVEKEWKKVEGWRKEEDRPWGDMKADKKGEVWTYVELPISHWIEEDTEGRRKAARKKKGGDGKGEGGRVVPGAA